MRVVDPVDGSTWMNNTVLTSGLVEPSNGSQPSYSGDRGDDHGRRGNHPLHSGRPGRATKLAVVYVQFFGQTLGGQNITSDQFQYPVDVCNGCLVFIPPNAATTNYCSGAVAGLGTAAACVPGQDQAIDCQKCYALPSGVCTGK